MLPPHLPTPGQPGGPPNLRPSYTVHISATNPEQMGTASTGGPTWLTSSGFRLQDLLSKFYNLPAERFEFEQPALADLRFDVALRLPVQESRSSIHQRIVQALEKQLGIAIRSVARIEDVYVITIADPRKLPSDQAASWGGFSGTATEFSIGKAELELKDKRALTRLFQEKLEDKRQQSGIALDSIDVDGEIEDLCRTLETGVQRPVLDRTGYRGRLRMSIYRNGLDRDQFFNKIEADYGLAITPAKAQIGYVIVSRAKAPGH